MSGSPNGPALVGADGAPVTTTVARRVTPGHETAYEQFLEGIIAAASRFEGYLGTDVIRPERGDGEYRIVYRFENGDELTRWLESDEHARWIRLAEPHVVGPMQTRYLTGLETWFTLPAGPGLDPPPRYKMALLTWVAIFPLITAVVVALGPILQGAPLLPRLAITTALTVPAMTWIVMPRLTRLLSRWLYPHTRGS